MSRSDRFDDEDDRPRRRRRDDDERDDRPSRRGRRYGSDAEEDYADDFRPRRRKGADGLGIASMIIGILSILIDLVTPFGACICPFVIVGVGLGLLGGILAMILGFMARSRTASGMGLAGIITGIAAIVLALVMIILVAAGVGFLALNAPPPPPNKAPGPNPNFNRPNKF